MTEAEHQILVMCWAKKISLAGRAELDLLFHVPNGGNRSGREGAMFKAMGVKAGVPDLCLPVPRGDFNNLWIEMKVDEDGASGKRGSTSEAQEKWHSSLEQHGGYVVVAFGWKNAVAAICGYLGGEWPEVDMETMEGRLSHG